jgi:hypothetical protein
MLDSFIDLLVANNGAVLRNAVTYAEHTVVIGSVLANARKYVAQVPGGSYAVQLIDAAALNFAKKAATAATPTQNKEPRA